MVTNPARTTYEKLCKISTSDDDPNILHHLFTFNGRRYTYNRDYIEHPDGSITGWLFTFDRNNFIVKKEDFKIEPDGYIKPGILKRFALRNKIIKIDTKIDK